MKIILDEYTKYRKRIPFHREISENIDTLNRQKTDLILAYNQIAIYSSLHFANLSDIEQEEIKEKNIKIQENLLVSLKRIGFNIKPGSKVKLFEKISENTIVKMTDITKLELLRLAGGQINKSYNGDPLTLQSFLDSVALLEDLATTTELKTVLVRFVLTKLEGSAREKISGNPKTILEITSALKEKIKPENSKIIEGRLIALKTDRVPLQEFSEQLNTLAESFRRALIVEGIPPAKADEVTIEKTVSVCRSNARSDLIKAVLASTNFSSPKEVVAKFLVEINTQTVEKQVLAYRTYNRGHNRGNYNKRGYNNNTRGNYNNNSNNNYNSNTHRNNRGHNNGYRGNNRGKNYYNSNNRGQDKHVKYAENLSAPQGTHWELGAETAATATVPGVVGQTQNQGYTN